MLLSDLDRQPQAENRGGAALNLGWLQPMELFGLSAYNYAMRILTLGVYHFWGKTEVRKRIWSATRINGEPLEYTGTGRELFLGFIVIFGVFMLPILLGSFAIALAIGPHSRWLGAFQLGLYILFFLLVGVATYRAQRYRLSRTRWRGIRGSLVGDSWHYGLTHFWTGLLIPLTLGWIIPWRSTKLQSLVVRDMRFGDKPLTFDATTGPLYLRFALLWVGSVAIISLATSVITGVVMADIGQFRPYQPRIATITPGAIAVIILVVIVAYLLYAVVSAWYRAGQINHFAAHTQFDGATFRSSVTAGGLMWLTVSNFLIVLFSLGMLVPIAQTRAARYYVQHLTIGGTVALDGILQAPDQHITKGEGLAQAFDVDAF